MTEAHGSRITFRSIAIGAALIPLICLWDVQIGFVWYSGQPTTVSVFWHVLVFITLFSLINQLFIRRYRPEWTFNPGELITIYVMLNIGAVMSSHDLLQILVPMMMHPYWNASPENGWEDNILPHIPEWLVVTDREAVRGAYEGKSTMYTMQVFRAFIGPMFWWGTFTFAFISMLLLLNVILRKQWVIREKLAYPLIQIPLEVVNEPVRLFRNRLFLYGFGLSAGIDLLNGLHVFWPLVPQLKLVYIITLGAYLPTPPWNAIGNLPVSIYPFAVGLCFFLPTDLAFSCWFFFFFWKAQRVIASALGVTSMPGFPYDPEQSAGGYLGLGFIALWLSRGHLYNVGKRVMGLPTELQDDDEPFTYRVSVILIALLGAYLVWFCRSAGMSWIVIGVFWLIFFIFAIAIARMRAELGPPAHDLHFQGPEQIITKAVGVQALGDSTVAMFSFFWFFNRAYRAHPMAFSLEGFKMAEVEKLENRKLFTAMMIALIVGIPAAYWSLLHVCYQYGISGSIRGPGIHFAREAWDRMNSWMVNPGEANLPATMALLIGLGCSLLLAVLRANFTWWIFHPVGYAVSATWSMEQMWLSMFIGWLLKWAILRYGGARAFRPAVPFFTGLVFGEFIVGGAWNTIGVIFGVPVYHFWPY